METTELHHFDQRCFPVEGDAVATDGFVAGVEVFGIFSIGDLLQGFVAVLFHFRRAGGTLCLDDHGTAVVHICEEEVKPAEAAFFVGFGLAAAPDEETGHEGVVVVFVVVHVTDGLPEEIGHQL